MLTTAAMGGHAWSVTSEDAKCERGRFSKVQARQPDFQKSKHDSP